MAFCAGVVGGSLGPGMTMPVWLIEQALIKKSYVCAAAWACAARSAGLAGKLVPSAGYSTDTRGRMGADTSTTSLPAAAAKRAVDSAAASVATTRIIRVIFMAAPAGK